MQPGEETDKGGMVGQDWFLAVSSYPSDTQRLEKEKYPWPETVEAVQELSVEELMMLLKGIDFFKAHKTLYYKNIS